MLSHLPTDDGTRSIDAQIWTDTHGRLKAWFDAFLPFWALALPVWADSMMIQIAHGHGSPAIAFPDPYKHAPPKQATDDTRPRFPVPRGWASQWEEASRIGEPGYLLTAHQTMAKNALLPQASQACIEACATAFPLLERRTPEPTLFRIQVRRRAVLFHWELSLARWDKGRSRWIDAGKPRPDLAFFHDRLEGTADIAA